MRKKWWLALLVLSFIFWQIPARAFSLSPSKIFITADAGSNQSVILNIYNDKEQAREFGLSVVGMKQDAAGRSIFTGKIEGGSGWVSPENKNVQVLAKETKKVRFNVDVPSGVISNSYHYGLLVTGKNLASGQVGLDEALAAILVLQVSGQANEMVEIKQWKARKQLVFNKEDWEFDLQLKNVGNIDFPVNGKMQINYFGKDFTRKELFLGNNFLAQTLRTFEPRIDFTEKFLWPGVYQTAVVVDYGRTGQTTTAVDYVWYIPIWFWALMLGVLFFVIIFKIRKNRHVSFEQ